jgi:glycosyltransferase involved in cell wall biosynthesis
MRVGIDIEQFVRDPYGSGIQRVLQYLAITWPESDVEPVFIAPLPGSPRGEFVALNAAQAAELLSIPFALPFEQTVGDRNVVEEVRLALLTSGAPVMSLSQVMSTCHIWFLPEVTYFPQVLTRFELFAKAMPTMMIGYDVFPMTAPSNYRFRPGTGAEVNGYFRALVTANSVVCISEFARQSMWNRLRRDRSLPCTVAHPGGDHVSAGKTGFDPNDRASRPVRFARLGTMEARKHPVEIVDAFITAIDSGVSAELLFIGRASASDSSINHRLESAIELGYSITWVQDASDAQVRELITDSDVFLSIGVEGYGIPVLEALQLATPVLYWGEQPAAEFMEGRGAASLVVDGVGVDGGDLHGALDYAFSQYSNRARLKGLLGEVRIESIPTWADFSSAVERAARELLA